MWGVGYTLTVIMLTSVDRALIDLEQTRWREPADTAAHCRWQAELLGKPDVERYDPLAIRRLWRVVADGPRRRVVGGHG